MRKARCVAALCSALSVALRTENMFIFRSKNIAPDAGEKESVSLLHGGKGPQQSQVVS